MLPRIPAYGAEILAPCVYKTTIPFCRKTFCALAYTTRKEKGRLATAFWSCFCNDHFMRYLQLAGAFTLHGTDTTLGSNTNAPAANAPANNLPHEVAPVFIVMLSEASMLP